MTDSDEANRRELDHMLSHVLEGCCPTCMSRLDAGVCHSCGLRYEASVDDTGRRVLVSLAYDDWQDS